jgi:hypothetical protein
MASIVEWNEECPILFARQLSPSVDRQESEGKVDLHLASTGKFADETVETSDGGL